MLSDLGPFETPGNDLIPREGLRHDLFRHRTVIALLDAACLPGLPERLESREIPAVSLFQGDLTQKLRDVAPYLVQMDTDGALMRDFVNDSDVPWAMWPKRPGILILAELDLPALQKHFRRLLRVRTDGGTFFFRFWEQASALAYFDALADSEDRGRWFYPREGGQIGALLVPDVRADGLRVFSAGGPRPDTRPWESRPFTLHPPELAALRDTRIQENIQQMIALMLRTFPDRASSLPAGQLEKRVRRSVSRAAEFGIRQRGNAFRLAAWDLHSDDVFEAVDPGKELRRILHAEMLEEDKMRLLAERLAQLGPAND
ncbi:DUF4123 domain-containing protein [Paracoccus xiamenensis]|uniref:DUF4123 domain-containing protein n=1 Tax=Paracoccus xiamenensis TaxID=2714901 RepID=UPI00140B6E42|nr:DUF4123 domain-containing protein [Paracoccus xiamenensis]NHF74316.1 DUF4123 domain-containing protein [Paracoccus xiamenensis]